MSKKYLVVLTGPVAGGKSSTAVSLAGIGSGRGLVTAAVDLDVVHRMICTDNTEESTDAWMIARRACGAIAESFFSSGLDLVVLEGWHFTSEAWEELLTCVRSDVDIRFFSLVVSREETVRRAKLDPAWDPPSEWVERMNDKFMRSMDFLKGASTCIETDGLSLEKVAERIADEVLGGS
jgi:hypothetical protein